MISFQKKEDKIIVEMGIQELEEITTNPDSVEILIYFLKTCKLGILQGKFRDEDSVCEIELTNMFKKYRNGSN